MNKRKAIKLLQNQKQIFIDRTYSDRDIWKHKTGSLVKDFCGNDSGEYKAMANFKFGVWSNNPDGEETKYELDRRRNIMIDLIDNCIDKVKRDGIQSSSNTPSPKSIIWSAAKNPIIQTMSTIVVIYSFLKIIEAIFNIDIPRI